MNNPHIQDLSQFVHVNAYAKLMRELRDRNRHLMICVAIIAFLSLSVVCLIGGIVWTLH